MLTTVRRLGGLAATHELYAAGLDRRSLSAAVRSHRILRVRQGWYAAPGTHRILFAAARVGGRATCTTALDLHGCWTPTQSSLHVACESHDSRLRHPRDSRKRLTASTPAHVHWRALPATGSRLILPPLESLRDALRCLDDELLPIVADSVLHTFPALRSRWAQFCRAAPRRHRRVLADADGVCESGIETMAWLRIRNLAPGVRRQVALPGVGDVDFVVGQRLVIEVDGEEFHAGSVAFERDRERDAILAAWGFAVLRFSFRQVTQRWGEVDAAIRAAIGAGWHLGR